MAARLQEVAWVVSMLDYCPDVDVLSLRVGADHLEAARDVLVDVVEVDVHVRGWAQAGDLARVLRLSEGPGRTSESDRGEAMGWRTWTGWAPDGSEQVPVWVSVCAAEPVFRPEAVA